MKHIKSYGMVVLGSCLTAAAFAFVVLPQGFAAGGATGLAVLLHAVIPLPVSALVLIINGLLFALGWFCVGRKFVFKTVIASIVFPMALGLMQRFPVCSELAADPLSSSLLAGTVLGLGAGLILLGNGSGGGFDIIGVVLNKKTGASVSAVMYTCDFVLILTQTFSNGILKTVYGVIVTVVAGLIVDRVLVRGKSAGRIFIFSKESERIRSELITKLDVGMTFMEGEGGYRREPIRVIMTVVHFDRVERIKKSVYAIDPTAFVIVDTVNYVSGRGYTLDR
ncbi:MAG: YitT family protein [Oscillospiraceae bacterium]|nr:YitT family protein [Oscillospiraceae bacterium]